VALLGLLWLRLPAPWRYLAMQWLSAVLIGAIVLRRADRIGPCARLLQQPWLVAAGALSYTLYMSHAAVLWFANQFARFVLKWPLALAEGSYKPQADLLPAMALAGGTMLAVFAVAASVTRWVEVPARQRFRRWAASLDRRQQPEALRQNRVPGA
jgi:peptidoglycan/LPS O-acetylase OafA/YrhL